MKRRNAYFTAGVLIASIGILTTVCSGKASDEKTVRKKIPFKGMKERMFLRKNKFWNFGMQ